MCETVKDSNQDVKKGFPKMLLKTRFHMIQISLMVSLMGYGDIWPLENFNSTITFFFSAKVDSSAPSLLQSV